MDIYGWKHPAVSPPLGTGQVFKIFIVSAYLSHKRIFFFFSKAWKPPCFCEKKIFCSKHTSASFKNSLFLKVTLLIICLKLVLLTTVAPSDGQFYNFIEMLALKTRVLESILYAAVLGFSRLSCCTSVRKTAADESKISSFFCSCSFHL